MELELGIQQLATAERESQQQKEREKRLLEDMAEKEIHWKEEHEMLVQKSLEDARSGDDGHPTEIKELRQSLDEAIEKSTVLQADLLQAEQCRDDFVSQNEQLSNDLQDAQRQYQQISIDDERLV